MEGFLQVSGPPGPGAGPSGERRRRLGAKLRLRTISGNSGSDAGGTFRRMSNTTWLETGTTWNNQPTIDGATLGTIGAVSGNTWYEVDVTAAVTGNGTYSFGATSTSGDGAYYDTRESGADAPQLVVATGSTTPPPSGDPVFVGAGDIADSGSGDSATATLLDSIPGTVFTTGDNVYDSGTASQFNPAGGADSSRGLRSFVAGMGGAGHYGFGTIQPTARRVTARRGAY
ncbi:DNRLRE domain-containing protein [Micromonospora arida]|uniref:CBM96 family carbohydrate-binding protein n=1 Tax=Micromonospora arida TaxID=2203715 RepID=UPI0033A40709